MTQEDRQPLSTAPDNIYLGIQDLGLNVDLEKEVEQWLSEQGIIGMKRLWMEFARHFYNRGLADKERKMLKEAVDTVVSLDAGGFPFIEFGVGKFGLKVGDKVRVIVLPKED